VCYVRRTCGVLQCCSNGLGLARAVDLYVAHTFATLLLVKGAHPKIVSEMLGHSSIAITLDAYSTMMPGLGEAEASAMEDALGE
jgi:site-specific recombinase XerD